MLTIFSGRVGDHNDDAMAAAGPLGDRIAERWSGEQHRVGAPAPALDRDWRTELAAAQGPLSELASTVRSAVEEGQRWLTVMPRCAGALATLPVVAEQYPGACVVWFDAHADVHLPGTTTSGYLGGMALSGPLGWWDSGFGAGVGDAVLVGTRDIDPAEHRLAAEHGIEVVAPGADLAERLAQVVGQRQVYVHVDCDVLDPGIVPTDYRVPDGLDLVDLHGAMRVLGRLEVLGVEIAELQQHPDGSVPDVGPLLTALRPVIDVVAG